MNGRLLHDAVFDALEPVVQPAQGLHTIIQVRAAAAHLAVVRWADGQLPGNSQIVVPVEHVGGEEVVPAHGHVDRDLGLVDSRDEGVQVHGLIKACAVCTRTILERTSACDLGRILDAAIALAFRKCLGQQHAVRIAVDRSGHPVEQGNQVVLSRKGQAEYAAGPFR